MFNGKFSFLSNFHPSQIKIWNMTFPTVENAHQARKTLDWSLRETFQAMTPGQAKRAGRKLAMAPGFDGIKVDHMRTCLRRKFLIPELRRQLEETGQLRLEEGNTWGDRFWGVCQTGPLTWTGANNLGLLLMEVRKDLQTGKFKEWEEFLAKDSEAIYGNS
jgi:ribA/ribD-fused uncharacterized protein